MAATVDALLPLSFLEAVRDVDRPTEEDAADFVDELRNKRLGLSDTVYAQIRRYADAARHRQRQRFDDVAALARLIGRRPDAEAVFRAAGCRVARQAYLTVPAMKRRGMLRLPRLVARPIAFRQARRLARRYFGGTVLRQGASLLFEVPASVTWNSAPPGVGCAFYEAGFHELLRLLVNTDGLVEHVVCETRREGRCQWRAEWRR